MAFVVFHCVPWCPVLSLGAPCGPVVSRLTFVVFHGAACCPAWLSRCPVVSHGGVPVGLKRILTRLVFHVFR